MCSSTSTASGSGRSTANSPMRTSRTGSGSSRTSARSIVTARRAPADLHQRPEDVASLRGGEERVEVGEELRRVGDGILGEEEVRKRLRLDPGLERVDADRAIDAEEAADAVEREACHELDRRKIGVDHRDQRVAGPGGQLCGDETECLQLKLLIGELQHPRVLRRRFVVGQKPSTGQSGSIDGESDAARRLEADLEISRPEIAAIIRKRDRRHYSDAIDDGAHRPQREACRGGALEFNVRVLRAKADVHGLDRKRTDR